LQVLKIGKNTQNSKNKVMNLKIRLLVYLLLFFVAAPVAAQNSGTTFKVVLDAGHGGNDPGCIGSKSKEKDVNLKMVQKVGKLITDNCPNVKVIYTRSTDVYVELYRRAQIANSNHADLFISFHCNAAEDHTATGVETWVMGLHKSEANQAVARAENSVILREKNYQNNYDGFDPNSPEANVLFSLYSSAYLKYSIFLADKVQKNMVHTSHLVDRGVKQGGLFVLYKVAMPSILLEMGFLSNLKDEEFLTSESNMNAMATTIYNAFADYYTTLSSGTAPQKTVPETVKPAPAPAKPVATITTPDDNTRTPAPAKAKEEVKKTENQSLSVAASSSPSGDAQNGQQVRFKVQFMATPEEIPLNSKRFSGIPNVGRFKENGLWKYTAGNETTDEAARKVLAEVKKVYKDAFVIGFDGDKKISEREAVLLLKK